MRYLPFALAYLCSCSLAVDDEARGYDARLDAGADAARTDRLVINEVAPKGRPDDWFELYNGSAEPVALDAFSYTDDAERAPVAFRESIVMQPGEYHVEFLDDSYPGFGFGAEEAILLYKGTSLLSGLRWTAADGISEEGTFARFPDVLGDAVVTLMPTPGFPNQFEETP